MEFYYLKSLKRNLLAGSIVLEGLSTVNFRDENGQLKPVEVSISNLYKPGITKILIDKWQPVLNTICSILNVPSSLIMKLDEDKIKVFLRGNTPENPYHLNDAEKLAYGLYCETVIAKQDVLIVPDARKDDRWKDGNPDIDLGMVSYMGVPFNWPDGEVFGTVCVLDAKENHYSESFKKLIVALKDSFEKDLELLVLQKKLKSNNLRLEKSNELKTKFLSLISHDLRGAVGSLNSFLKLILNDKESWEQVDLIKSLTVLSGQTDTVHKTLLDILQWSKVEMAELQAHFEKTDLECLLDKVVAFYGGQSADKDVKFVIDKSGGVCANADKNMAEAIIRNLISNAVKFSPQNGYVFLSTYYKEEISYFRIKDQGIGMTDDMIEELFHQAPSSKIKPSKCKNGIGLLLVKEFIGRNNGSIEVKSELGKGTEIIVGLPKYTS
ncbi:MAG: GAF domain-containing sensor histidine kinase [Bacteroidota bacterium]